MNNRRSLTVLLVLFLLHALPALPVSAQTRRPMTFMDVQGLKQASAPEISPDGKWGLYTLSEPDWNTAKRYTDIYLVSVERGSASARRMTFTGEKNETNPVWARSGAFFVFASNRDAPATSRNQLYLMRPDGGEARRITNSKDGVGAFAFSRDGKWLAFSAGKDDEQQIWVLPVAEIETAQPKQLTNHSTPVTSWQFSPDSRTIYFLSPDSFDKANIERLEKKFNVQIRNMETPLTHLWAFDLATGSEKRLTTGGDYTVSNVTISKDSRWIGFTGTPADRYQRTVTESAIYADLYLIDSSTGRIERLTENSEIAESPLSFSPDSRLMAFSASDDFEYFRNSRVNVRPIAGGKWKELGDGNDLDLTVGFWSPDGKTIYFNEGIGTGNQLCSVSTETGQVARLTKFNGVLNVSRDDDSQALLLAYADAGSAFDYYTISSPGKIAARAEWIRLTDANPQIGTYSLGAAETISWKSTDGKMVEGILIKPVDYRAGVRYPLIVQIHGGPAGADVMRFNPGYNSQVYAGAGYAVLCPNYRGSVNYGERHKMEIGGDYFRQGYDDIMAGVDHLISIGLVDPDKMGVMGWSAGGHWSNWILTHTDRFKAISSGAGAVNWISMYAQSDVQRNREFYFGGRPPYEDFSKYWDVSPLKYIRNAKTPTMIHVVDGDPRVPRPQSEELYMALRKLGVPTEFLVYPGNTHGIPDPRNQFFKATVEFNWFEKYIRGKDGWLDWKEFLKTLDNDKSVKESSDSH